MKTNYTYAELVLMEVPEFTAIYNAVIIEECEEYDGRNTFSLDMANRIKAELQRRLEGIAPDENKMHGEG